MDEESIFQEALKRTAPAERASFLDEACRENESLRCGVDQLLAAHDLAGSFLISPPAELDATALYTIHERPGAEIGPYKLLQQIGEGGFGVVFMAEQERPIRRKVALKIIKPGMDTREVVARFEAERQALALMEHVNIARVLDAGATASGLPYFVMELVRGVPITEYCDKNNLPLDDRLELFVHVCQAVQHAHQKGVIHRDIKPSNVLVTLHDGVPVPKIIDFGIAKATNQRLTEKTLFTKFASMVGTPLYMSPEQAEMSGLDVDTRSDIYSLGVLLYELLTGTTPFEAGRLRSAGYDEMRRIIREEEPPRPSNRISTLGDTSTAMAAHRRLDPQQLGHAVRGELDWIVMKSLEKDRSRRYETANGLSKDVQRYLSDEPVEACPPSVTYRFRKLARRHKAALATAALVAAILLVSTIVSVWAAISEHRAEQLAQTRLEAESAARKLAVTQSNKATTINELLQQMLQAADPNAAHGADYTVRQLLDKFSHDLKDQLKDEPEVEAAIRATIGKAYQGLGLAQKAKPHLQFALDTRLRLFGPDNADVAQSHLDWAWNLFEGGDMAGAEASARTALAIHQKIHAQQRAIVSSLAALHLFLELQRKYSECDEVAEQILAIARQQPDRFPELANVLHHYADSALNQGDKVKAERLAREALALHRKVHGDSHPETGWGLFQLGRALQEQVKLDEAEACYREALTIFRKQYNDSHKSIQYVARALTDVLNAKGDEAGVKQLNDELSARLSATTAGLDDPHFHVYAARLALSTGDRSKAIAECSAAIVADPESTEAWSVRGACYLAMDEFTKAASDFTAATRLNPRDWWLWHEQAYALDRAGERTKAIAALTRSLELRDIESAPQQSLGASADKPQVSDANFTNAIELDPVNWESREISSSEKTALALAAQTSRPLTNGDFSAGTQGWTAEGGGHSFGIWRDSIGIGFTTYGAHQDADTGRLYQCFKVPDDATALKFLLQGGSDEKRIYVALWRQDRVWKYATARNDNTHFAVEWDLTPLRGEVVTLEIVDHTRVGYGFIGVRDFAIVRP